VSGRLQRVNQLIKKELSQILLREFEFPVGVLVTVTRVDSSANLIKAKVFISVMPEERSSGVLENLNQKIFALQQKINKRLKMRPVPQIIFLAEKKTREAGRIEEILEELKKDYDPPPFDPAYPP